MKYLVTFCTFDQTVEGNPFWHGSFILSKLNKTTMQLEVDDTWGFYGVPATGNRTHWLTQLKRSIGLDLDFFGNHGWLIREEIRYMDLGHGLHGYSYELTEEQYKRLQTECTKRAVDQESAIKDSLQGVNVTAAKKYRHYPQEQYSKQLYDIELAKAKIENREPRLHAFDFKLSWQWYRPSLNNSHTCKTEALSILETVLTSEQLKPFRAHTFPRIVSGNMEDILLYSEGPLDVHTKANGEQIYYRKRETEGVKLVWSIPPQKIEELEDSGTKNFFAVDEEYCDEAKAIVKKLQALEWLFRNTKIDKQYGNNRKINEIHKEYQKNLLDKIVACYKNFSVIKPETKRPKISGWVGSVYSLFSQPKNEEQADLKMHIEEAKFLFNSLYMAIVDSWKMIDSFSSDDNEEEAGVTDAWEAVVSYLSVENQQKVCKIIDRNYCNNESSVSFAAP